MSSLSGRSVLVTGGSSGIGLALVRALHERGAEVVVGTRRRERFDAIAAELGGGRLHPFLADLTDPAELDSALAAMTAEAPAVTDLVHSAAGGLEPIVRDLLRRVMGLRRVPPEQRESALRSAREEVARLVAENRSAAMAINFEAPVRLVSRLVPALPRGGTVSFYSSLWSTFYGAAPVPRFYASVAESKLALERWLEERAPGWAERGLSTVIVSGHTTRDTSMGQLIDRHLAPLLPASRQEPFRRFFIDSAEMVAAEVDLLEQAAAGRLPPGLVRRYVYGPRVVAAEMDAGAEALADLIPL